MGLFESSQPRRRELDVGVGGAGKVGGADSGGEGG